MLPAAGVTTPDKRVIVDAVREVRPPFSPSAVVDDFATLLKSYRVSKVVGDHYGGEFVKEPFRRHGISYELCKQPKSDLFRDMLPLLDAGHITLPRHDRLIAQIVGLERRRRGPAATASITRRAHTMILPMRLRVFALTTAKSYDLSLDWVSGPDVDRGMLGKRRAYRNTSEGMGNSVPLTVNQRVPGSSPGAPTNKITADTYSRIDERRSDRVCC